MNKSRLKRKIQRHKGIVQRLLYRRHKQQQRHLQNAAIAMPALRPLLGFLRNMMWKHGHI